MLCQKYIPFHDCQSVPRAAYLLCVIDEFQINEINVDLRTSGFDNEVLSVDACAVWWERESFYCLPRISVVTWHREPRFQCGSARTCSIWNSSIETRENDMWLTVTRCSLQWTLIIWITKRRCVNRRACANEIALLSCHSHCTHGTCGVLHCLLFCDQTRPNLRISLVGYHCAIEFPCGVLLFYCCKYPTTYGVRVHPEAHIKTMLS